MEELPLLDRSVIVSDVQLSIPSGRSFSLSSLPSGQVMADALRSAMPDLQVWLIVAVRETSFFFLLCARILTQSLLQLEYYRLGRRDDFRVILERTQMADLSSELPDAFDEARRVINALAWYYIGLANSERDPQAREDALHEVSKWTNRANRMEGHVLTSTAMAMGYLAQGKTDQVENYLDQVKDRETTIATMLVRATLHFTKGEYSDALALFSRVLRAKPNCSAQVRFGLGMCYFKLERRDMAEKCFVRALELNSQLVEPRVALAILKVNTGDMQQVQPAMKLLQEAYKIDDNHPRVLNFLADHFLHRREFEKGTKLAERARSNADSDRIYAESEYHLARACHAQGNFAAAQTHYESSVQKDSGNVLTQLGLAQVLLHSGNTERAVGCLETVLHRYPDDLATLQILGTLHARKGHVEAKELLQRAIDVDSKDPEVLIEFAELMESVDRSKSLRAYRAALKLLAERGKEKPERMRDLQNNVAVMMHRLGQHTQAEEAYGQVFADVSTDAERVNVSVSTSFNLARLYEDMHRWDAARSLYEAILAKHVTYTDCYLRLASIARTANNVDEAMRQLNLALTVHEDLPDALAMMGNIHIERNEFHAAQLKFTRILEKVDRNDPYALLSLGNIYYMARADKKDRKERNMKHAAESYWKVLKTDHSNLYAANGLGVVFAAEGRLGAAGEIFTRVREGTSAMGDVVVNLAHIYMGKGEFLKAVTLYESALRKQFRNSHPKIMLYLSKAYFEAKDFAKAEEYLQRCQQAAVKKDAESLRFNHALILEHKARRYLDAAGTPLIDEAKRALDDVEKARAMFQDILDTIETALPEPLVQENNDEKANGESVATASAAAATAPVPAGGVTPVGGAGDVLSGPSANARRDESAEVAKKCREHLAQCERLVQTAETKLQNAQSFSQDEATIKQQREERFQQRLLAKKEAEARRQEAELARAAELASIAEKDMLVLREEMVHWKPLSVGSGGGGGGAGGERGKEGGGERKKKKKEKRKEMTDELADLSPSPTKAAKREAAALERQASQQASSSNAGQAGAADDHTESRPAASRKGAAAAAAAADDDDELEEWQKARMNAKLSSLVESKRVREDRDKRGYSKRRNAEPANADESAPPGGGAGEDK